MTSKDLKETQEYVSYVVQAGDGTFLTCNQESNTEVMVFSLKTPHNADYFDTEEDANEHIKKLIEGHEYFSFYGQEDIPKPYKVREITLTIKPEITP